MVSDSELIGRLREFLKNSDLETTTTTIVRRKLEEDFGVDLSDKKGFIREQVDLFLQSQFEAQAAENEDGVDDRQSEEGGGGDEVDEEEEEEEEVEEEEEAAVRRSSKRKTRAKGRSRKQPEEGKKRGGGGFTKLCRLSPQLHEFLGAPEMARTEVVKQLWVYIKEKELQDPSNKRNILCDEPLRTIFCVDSIDMFQMNKALTKHIWPLDPNDVIPVKTATQNEKQMKQESEEVIPVKKEKQMKQEREEDIPVKTQKEKQVKQEREEDIPVKTATQKEKQVKQEREEEPDDPGRKEKRQKTGTSGFMAPLQLSDPLAKFLGTGENAMSRSEVIKRMWDYIKQNNLQDPSDRRKIICDEKLKELFDVDTFVGFTVTKLLSAHFVKS